MNKNPKFPPRQLYASLLVLGIICAFYFSPLYAKAQELPASKVQQLASLLDVLRELVEKLRESINQPTLGAAALRAQVTQPAAGLILTNTWNKMSPLGDGDPAVYGNLRVPRKRGEYQLSYDPVTNEAVLFGGEWNGYRSDTWTYNFTENFWHIRRTHPDLTGPCRRDNQNLVYDPVSKLQWLFNGIAYDDKQPGCADGFTYARAGIWTYNRVTNQWSKELSVQGDLHNVLGGGIAYDPASHSFFEFGGAPLTTSTYQFTIATKTWKKLSPTLSPPKRDDIQSALVYDEKNKVFVLFGGKDNTTMYGDTWIFDPATLQWRNANPVGAPPARHNHAMAYDPQNGVIVLFGGNIKNTITDSTAYLSDTWVYDTAANKWTELTPANTPGNMQMMSMVYDPANSLFIMYPGSSNDETWVFKYSPQLGGQDTTPPLRFNVKPTGILPRGTTLTTLSLDTDENATCKYGTVSGVAYDFLSNTFGTTGAKAHSSIILGLADGATYNYYVRCSDALGNKNTSDFTISFSVAADPTPILFVTPTSLSFSALAGGTNPQAETISIQNTGGGTMNWTVNSNAAWLTATPTNGKNKANVTVNASVAGLSVGTYNAILTITAVGATGSPKTIPVSFSVISSVPGGLYVPLIIEEALESPAFPGKNRASEPVSVGIPLPENSGIANINQLGLLGANAGQFKILARWPNNNIKWVLVDTEATVSAGSKNNSIALVSGTGNFGGANMAADQGSSISVDTGPAQFIVKKANFNIFEKATIDGQEIVAPNSGGSLIMRDSNGAVFSSANDGNSQAVIEENGPVKTVVRADGSFKDAAGKRLAEYTMRLFFFKGKSYAKSEFTFRNANKNYPSDITFSSVEANIKTNLESSKTVHIAKKVGAVSSALGAGETAFAYQGFSTDKLGPEGSDLCTSWDPPLAGTCTEFFGGKRFDPDPTQKGLRIMVGSTEFNAPGNQNDWTQGYADLSDSSGKGVTIAQRWMSAYWPAGLELGGDGHVSIELFSKRNLKKDLIMFFGKHETREILWDFHSATADTGLSLYRLQYPLIARVPVSQYQEARALFNQSELPSIDQQNQFFTQVLGTTPRPLSLQTSFDQVYRVYSWGSPNQQMDKSLDYFVNYIRGGGAYFYLLGEQRAQFNANTAVVHSDNYATEIFNLVNSKWDNPDDVGGKGGISGGFYDREHAHFLNMPMYYYLSGDEHAKESAIDYGEYQDRRLIRGNRKSILPLPYFRAFLRNYRNLAITYELTCSLPSGCNQRYLDYLKETTNTLLDQRDDPLNLNVKTSPQGRNMERGYNYQDITVSQDQDYLTRALHSLFQTFMHADNVWQAWRVLKDTGSNYPRLEELEDYLEGVSRQILTEAYEERSGLLKLREFGFRTEYYLDKVPTELDRPLTPYSLGRAAIIAFEKTGKESFLKIGYKNLWGHSSSDSPMMTAEPQGQAIISAYYKKPAVWGMIDDNKLNVQNLGGGSYTLSWTVPQGATKYQIKYADKPIVDWLGFDPIARTYQFNPANYKAFFAATNISNEPAPLAVGATQTFTINGLPAAGMNFAIRYYGGPILPLNQPALTFTASPFAVNAGGTSTLSWLGTNVSTCTASGGWTGSKPISGTQIVTLNATTIYTLSCTGAEGPVQRSVSITVNVPGQDTTPPARFNGKPTGTLAQGTTSTTLSLDTDENATCKYGTVAGVAYDSLANTFGTTGVKTHSSIISGLTNGTTYNYYARCRDVLGNKNTNDFTISFSVASVSTPPGTFLIKRVGPSETIADAPPTSAWIDNGAQVNANPASFVSIAVGNHTVNVTNVAGNTITAGTCTYPVGGSECTILTFPVSLSCAGGLCSLSSVPVLSNTVTKVAVKYAPASPTLSAAPATLSFSAQVGGSSPPSQTISIQNTGGGTMNWTVSSNAPWLTLAPANGTNNSNVTVNASVSGLGVGTHNAMLTITAVGAAGSPKTIPVSFSVVSLNSPTLNFTALPFAVNAGGTSVLSWSGVNVSTCTASGGWSGIKSISGSQTVTPAETTTYTLTCTGAGGSTSQSATVIVTQTGDAQAPSTPSGLFAVAVPPSQINLFWFASTDNVGVTGYRIYRGGAYLATTATTSYQNTGLTASTTYSYTVAAYDAAGNESPRSESVSISIPPLSFSMSVSLSASPSSGAAPLQGVDLTASISGTAQGNINYIFYCNREDAGVNVTEPWQAKFNNIQETTKTAADLCTYSVPGNYKAKVIAERGATSTQAQLIIEVRQPQTILQNIVVLFTKPLQRGSRHPEVRVLQKLLIREKLLEEGNDTGYFGALTENAVRRFQIKYSILPSNSPDLGLVGPKTRVKLNEIAGGGVSATEEAKRELIKNLQQQLIILMTRLHELLQQLLELKKAGG